jgi:probable phosphoglycerate mutase
VSPAAVTAGPADLGTPTTLILIRHGRTEATARVLSGGAVPGPPLNDAGESEAAAAAAFLARLPADARGGPGDVLALPGVLPRPGVFPRPDVLITSPVRRAQQTAAAAAAALGLTLSSDPDWAEADHGDWDGLAFTEIARRWPDAYRAWHSSPEFAAPGGESASQVALRALRARDRVIAATPGRCIAVFSHVTPIVAVLSAALEAGPAARWRLRIDPGSISVLRVWADGGCEVALVNARPWTP